MNSSNQITVVQYNLNGGRCGQRFTSSVARSDCQGVAAHRLAVQNVSNGDHTSLCIDGKFAVTSSEFVIEMRIRTQIIIGSFQSGHRESDSFVFSDVHSERMNAKVRR